MLCRIILPLFRFTNHDIVIEWLARFCVIRLRVCAGHKVNNVNVNYQPLWFRTQMTDLHLAQFIVS